MRLSGSICGVAAARCTSVGVPPALVPFAMQIQWLELLYSEHERERRGVRAQQLSEQTQIETLGYLPRLSDIDLSLLPLRAEST